MNVILQIDKPFQIDTDPRPIQNAVQTTVQLVRGNTEDGVNITITNEDAIQQLNYQYRGLNTPTDVLSFAYSPDPDFPKIDPMMSHYLGDIIIAYPVAKTQAKVRGHSVQDEIILLAVHGTLHLLGFDHATPAQKEKMWAVQQQIMTSLGLVHVQPTE